MIAAWTKRRAAGTDRRGIRRINRSETRDGIRRVQVKCQMFYRRVVVCPLDAITIARLFGSDGDQYLKQQLASATTPSRVTAPSLFDFGAQQVVQGDDAQDFPAVVIHQNDEVAG